MINLYIELNTFLILTVIAPFIYDDLPAYLYDGFELTLVVLIYTSIMIPALINISILIYNIIINLRQRTNQINIEETT